MRLITFCFLLNITLFFAVHAQNDSLLIKSMGGITAKPDSTGSDSTIKINRQQFMADSIAMRYLMPDPLREDQFISNLLKSDLSHLTSITSMGLKAKAILQSGLPRKARDPWLVYAIIGLLIYTALLNIFFSKDVSNVVQSFYSKTTLSYIDKEGGLINIWAFVGLFILFSLTSGFVLYQITKYYNIYYSISGFRLFILLSAIISLLFTVKFLVLKFVSFIFDINRPVSQYIAILNLTYFNITFVLLSIAICFCLLSTQYIPSLLIITLIIIAIIFAWQFIRNSLNIISNFRFHKFYLFIYLCALEICPILILIKALNI